MVKRSKILIFDTDMGTDDALAYLILWNIVHQEVFLITSYGNVDEEQAHKNAQLLNNFMGDYAEIYRGASSPVRGDPKYAYNIHGSDGLGGGTKKSGKNFDNLPIANGSISDLVQCLQVGAPVEISWLSTGPATNLSFLKNSYPEIYYGLDSITLMSGVFFDKGNVTSSAEFNAFCDPEALYDIFASGKCLNIVPLDVCRKIQFRYDELEEAFSILEDPFKFLLKKAHYEYAGMYRESDGFFGCYPHDSIALLAWKYPEMFYFFEGIAECDRQGACVGRTSFLMRQGGPHKLGMGVCSKFVWEKIYNLGKI